MTPPPLPPLTKAHIHDIHTPRNKEDEIVSCIDRKTFSNILCACQSFSAFKPNARMLFIELTFALWNRMKRRKKHKRSVWLSYGSMRKREEKKMSVFNLHIRKTLACIAFSI